MYCVGVITDVDVGRRNKFLSMVWLLQVWPAEVHAHAVVDVDVDIR